MPWVRIHDGALTHPKIGQLINLSQPFHLWVWGLSQAQMHLTDGFIHAKSVPKRALKAAAELVESGLWEIHPDGWMIHDYLDWNDSRREVRQQRKNNRDRLMFFRNPELRHQLRARDGDVCRYCGRDVNWLDRKGAYGATYDHVDPYGDATLENLVVACRGCNSSKRGRTPEQAGMVLLPPAGSRSDLDRKSERIQKKSGPTLPDPPNPSIREVKNTSLAPAKEPPDPRVREFLTWFPDQYREMRHGAAFLVKWERDGKLVKQMLAATDLERLKRLAQIMLSDKCEDEFITQTDRGIQVLSAKFNWLSERLAAWEARQRA